MEALEFQQPISGLLRLRSCCAAVLAKFRPPVPPLLGICYGDVANALS
jgi:hypothetical protein